MRWDTDSREHGLPQAADRCTRQKSGDLPVADASSRRPPRPPVPSA